MEIKKLLRLVTKDFKITKKPKHWVEEMTYTELLAERVFLRKEIHRLKKALHYLREVDPRGVWGTELIKIDDKLCGMEKNCQDTIELCENEMIKRMQDGP